MTDKIITVRFSIENRRIGEELERIMSSLKGFRVQNSTNPKPCDILVMETGENLRQDLEKINSAKTSGMAKEIFLTSTRFDSEFMIQTLRMGVREFFVQPINTEELVRALL